MKSVVLIRLELEGDRDDAFRVIDWALDEGVLQDAINTCEGLDGVGKVRVTSAMSHPENLTTEEQDALSDCFDVVGDALVHEIRRVRRATGQEPADLVKRAAQLDALRTRLGGL